jgi:hypothetical protein
MSPSALNPRTEVIEVVCSMSLAEMPEDVKALEEQIIAKVQESGRQFYTLCLCAFQQRWLQERRVDYTAVRWRTIDQLTPFGLIRFPVRVIRERGVMRGGYRTLSKACFGPKRHGCFRRGWKSALEAATGVNYRPAAAELWRWLRFDVQSAFASRGDAATVTPLSLQVACVSCAICLCFFLLLHSVRGSFVEPIRGRSLLSASALSLASLQSLCRRLPPSPRLRP